MLADNYTSRPSIRLKTSQYGKSDSVNDSESPFSEDTVVFGRYEQDNDESNDPEPLEWKILARDGDSCLMITDKVIDNRCYNYENDTVIWSECNLRLWLNEDFYNNAFNDEEKAKIIQQLSEETKVAPYSDEVYDYITIPSSSDFYNYIKKLDIAIHSEPTEYALEYGVESYKSSINYPYTINSPYLIRSLTGSANVIHSAYMDELSENSLDVTSYCGLRPMIKVVLD